jgi:hypothetical protein
MLLGIEISIQWQNILQQLAMPSIVFEKLETAPYHGRHVKDQRELRISTGA